MIGTILDYSAGQDEGAISGDDGQRYVFAGADWKSPSAAGAGLRVDFVADGAHARGVYLLPGAASLAGEVNPGVMQAGSPSGFRFHGGTAAPIALIIGSFLPFLAVPVVAPNLWTLAGLASLGGEFGLGRLPGTLMLLYLLWLVPLLAGWLLYRELKGLPTRSARLATGLAGLLLPFLILFIVATSMGGVEGGALFFQALRFMGIGWITILIASIALFVTTGRSAAPVATPQQTWDNPTRPVDAEKSCPICGERYGAQAVTCSKDGAALV